jgi:hypothetical protein
MELVRYCMDNFSNEQHMLQDSAPTGEVALIMFEYSLVYNFPS